MYNQFFESYKNMFDVNQGFATVRRNLETASAATQKAVQVMQEISRRNAEVARDNIECVLKSSKDMLTAGSPESNLNKHSDMTKTILENTLANLREITEMTTKSSLEAFDLFNRRAAESMEELSAATGKMNTQKKKAA